MSGERVRLKMARKAHKPVGVRKGGKGWAALPKLYLRALEWQEEEARLLKGRQKDYLRQQLRKRGGWKHRETSTHRAEGCQCGAMSWKAECPVHGLKERG